MNKSNEILPDNFDTSLYERLWKQVHVLEFTTIT